MQPNEVNRRIGALIKKINKDVSNQEAMDFLIKICKREGQAFNSRRQSSQGSYEVNLLMAQVIKATLVVQDSQLVLEIIKGCARWLLGVNIHNAVAEAILIFPFRQVEPRQVTTLL